MKDRGNIFSQFMHLKYGEKENYSFTIFYGYYRINSKSPIEEFKLYTNGLL